MRWIWIISSFTALALIYIATYNSLVRLKQKAMEAWSGIDVQLKRRHDLIPQLIEVVKGYAQHESKLFEEVARIRAEAIAIPPNHPKELGGAENMLVGYMRSVFAIAEQYPQLKANQNFLKLQEQLKETEDQISASRRIYNANTKELNTKIKSFPHNMVAATSGFKEFEFFQSDK